MDRLTIQVGSYEVNCSILYESGLAWIVDPGQEGDRIAGLIEGKGLVPAAILLTHAHFDHISGIPALKKRFPDLPVYVHPADMPMFGHPMNQYPGEYASIGVPENLKDVADLPSVLPSVSVIETPGHTPGGVCYHFPQDALLLSGDTLFAGSIGRTDFPGGSMARMVESLRLLTALPDGTLVIPGHGPHTTIAAEKRSNPYLV
ncbi:MAG: MBL fold metallo-hydrolase [Kiritimatiellae bacterium]|nr:MBL fold metallo-hydrolase [Kiritimatiellia bacterium]